MRKAPQVHSTIMPLLIIINNAIIIIHTPTTNTTILKSVIQRIMLKAIKTIMDMECRLNINRQVTLHTTMVLKDMII
jgi:hypothetical protein